MSEAAARPTFEQVAVTDPRLDALLDELRTTHVNGGALLACFAVHHPGDRRWYWNPVPKRPATHDFSAFLASEALATALPELRAGDGAIEDAAWENTGPYTLDGELTALLVQGGAYYRYPGPPHEAKRLATAFCDAIFGDRYLDVDVYRSYRCWSPWFGGVFDFAWIIVDNGMNRVWLLCVSDTD